MRFEEQYEFLQTLNQPVKIGYGAYSKVLLARNILTKQIYAVKIMDKQQGITKGVLDIMLNEQQVHRLLNHENIIRFIDVFETNANIYIVQEYAENGSLFHYLWNVKKFREDEARKYFLQVCQAIKYLHSINLMYRDLKPENMLLDSKLHIKLCDFGSCVPFQIMNNKRLVGTLEYMAPEILARQSYDFRVDLWSLGVLLYELLHGQTPFSGETNEQILASIHKQGYAIDNNLSFEAKSLIQRLLRLIPQERPLINDIINDAWSRFSNQNIVYSVQSNDQQSKPIAQVSDQGVPKLNTRFFSPQKRIVRTLSNNAVKPIRYHKSPQFLVKQREKVQQNKDENQSPSPPKYLQKTVATQNNYTVMSNDPSKQQGFISLVQVKNKEKLALPTQRIKDKAQGMINTGALEELSPVQKHIQQNQNEKRDTLKKITLFQGRPKN